MERSDENQAESETALEIQDVDKELKSTGDESDPFDLITGKVLGPDGYVWTWFYQWHIKYIYTLLYMYVTMK